MHSIEKEVSLLSAELNVSKHKESQRCSFFADERELRQLAGFLTGHCLDNISKYRSKPLMISADSPFHPGYFDTVSNVHPQNLQLSLISSRSIISCSLCTPTAGRNFAGSRSSIHFLYSENFVLYMVFELVELLWYCERS